VAQKEKGWTREETSGGGQWREIGRLFNERVRDKVGGNGIKKKKIKEEKGTGKRKRAKALKGGYHSSC